MSFDINSTLSDMTSVIKGTVGDNWKEAKTVVEQFTRNRKERLEMIAQLRISGELNQEDFLSRLADEKLVMEAELNAIKVIGKAVTQKAANAAMDILEKAVTTAISSAL